MRGRLPSYHRLRGLRFAVPGVLFSWRGWEGMVTHSGNGFALTVNRWPGLTR
jgi:hypothetical protein